MARVKRAMHARKHHKAILEEAKGYYGNKSRSFRSANEAVMHAGRYAFRDRRARKGDFRKLWIQRINAACRENEMSYSRFINGLHNAGIEVDRKVLADIAVTDPGTFAQLVTAAKAAVTDHTTQAAPAPRLKLPDSRAADTVRLGYKHPQVQRLRRLAGRKDARDAERVFVAEGFKLLEEGLNAAILPQTVFIAPDTDHQAVERARGVGAPVVVLESYVLERVSDTVTPQGVMSLFPYTDVALDTCRPPLMVLVNVRDPGNVGTIMRSAEAAGLAAVVLSKGSADVYSPKVVRASAGAIFAVSFVRDVGTDEVLAWLARKNILSLATAMDGHTPYDQVDLTEGVALIMGNEATGLPFDVQAAVSKTISIPMAGRAESLNVAMAATILSFEFARQNRSHR